MKLQLAFEDSEVRSLLYYLRKKYKSKAALPSLAKLAIRKEAAVQAGIELAKLAKES